LPAFRLVIRFWQKLITQLLDGAFRHIGKAQLASAEQVGISSKFLIIVHK